ncbi:MAG: HNH endonuclease signature motif containing protein [Candidatus Nanopelagicaceae bacterium]
MSKSKTSIRDRHRKILRARRGPCGICKGDIDYSLPYLHPLSFEVDHVLPTAKGGPDVIENKQASHRKCNREKSAHIEWDPVRKVGVIIKRVRTY